MFPYGNNVDHASFYLEQGYPDSKPPDDYVCCAQFGLVLWNPNCPEVFTSHTAHHRFTKEEGDWGFTRFVELRKLWTNSWADTGRFLVENDEAMVTAYVRIVKDETGVLWHNFVNYDSKKETGYVGLKNQGATCYLNSLIQSLYFTNAFRKVSLASFSESSILIKARPSTKFLPVKKKPCQIRHTPFNAYFTNSRRPILLWVPMSLRNLSVGRRDIYLSSKMCRSYHESLWNEWKRK
jgi:hypothetical protein